jgi:hypothetical protein
LSPNSARDERFALLEASPLLAELLAQEPDERAPRGSIAGTLAALALAFMVLGALAIVLFGVCAPLGFLPLAGMGVLLVQLLRPQPVVNPGQPVERFSAVVHGTRTGLAGDTEAQAETVVTTELETADGGRRDVVTSERLLERLSRGDFGVAYVRGGVLVDFQRVESA